MADTLTNISNFINSPPGQLAAGAVLAGIVWKSFQAVESILSDDTKLAIAVWLLGVKVGQKVEPWSRTCANVFDELFGWSDRGFSPVRIVIYSCFLTFAAILVSITVGLFRIARNDPRTPALPFTLSRGFSEFNYVTVWPILLSVVASRYLMVLMSRTESTWKWIGIAAAQFSLCLYLGFCGLKTAALLNPGVEFSDVATAISFWPNLVKMAAIPLRGNLPLDVVYPVLLTSLSFWLYAGSGFLLKFARRFDIGFQWFNSKVDIEHKPLSAIGLVAGALVAVLWWTVVVVRWIV